jgi:hypothetical protein
MQSYLKNAAALLGEAGREIFPKQSEILVDRGDTGNFLNLPYFGGDAGTRYAFHPNGDSATLDEFFELYEANVQELPIKIPEPPAQAESPIKDGPPCLQALCAQGFPRGLATMDYSTLVYTLKKHTPMTGKTKWWSTTSSTCRRLFQITRFSWF